MNQILVFVVVKFLFFDSIMDNVEIESLMNQKMPGRTSENRQ